MLVMHALCATQSNTGLEKTLVRGVLLTSHIIDNLIMNLNDYIGHIMMIGNYSIVILQLF